MVRKFIVALLMAALLSCDIAFADETTTDAVSVSADKDAAYINGSSFAIGDFSRAQKGAVREAPGIGEVYSYYQGSSDDMVIVVAMEDAVLAYIPESVHALCDIEDKTSTEQLKQYFCALDASAVNGGVVLSPNSDWQFTSENDLEFNGLRILFGVEIGEGKRYVCIANPESAQLPTHVDFGCVKTPSAVNIVPEATGFEAFTQFLAGIDMSPLWVTLRTTGVAIVFIFVLGLAAAYFTMRIPKRAQDIFDTIFTIPMVLPPTVCGFILLWCLGRNTALGQWFIDIGFPLIFSWPATVIAATVVAFPLMYRSSRGAFENLDANMLDAARTLGWSNLRIFFRLMIPLSWSSIAAATVLAFARALGEFGATLFLAGNYVGITRTIPIAIYFEWMGGNVEVAWFWTAVILVFSFLVILIINLLGHRTTRYRRRSSSDDSSKSSSALTDKSHISHNDIAQESGSK
ncbi:molybdate ABC transporter permease subunit [Adlercreutzia sp. ZJ154]|uniref:molybdate ABC transporter permease subunit n=1 Tax=Adlercreutzia sp. ZJ154 TaxID=2709790 RepID=UPI0013ED2D7B|nr:molybdate ABC transporter permease subunit [Adlercreutzia sp. ZJ154]